MDEQPSEPGNRTHYITKEAEALTVASAADDRGFAPIKTALRRCRRRRRWPNWPSGRTSRQTARSIGRHARPAGAPPSAEYRSINGGRVFQADVPANWTSLPTSNAIRIVPENGYGQLNGQTVFSHGIEFGVAQAGTRESAGRDHDVAESSGAEQPAARARRRTAGHAGSPSARPSPRRSSIRRRSGAGADRRLYDVSRGRNALLLPDHRPDTESQAYDEVFQRIGRSLKLTDVR